MADNNNKPNDQERQISIKLKDKIITLPESKLNSLINERVMKKINDDKIKMETITKEQKLKIANLKSIANNYEVQVKVFQHLLGRLKRDLVVDENAQPARYAAQSVYRNIRMKQIQKNMNQHVATLTISDDELDNTPMTTMRSTAIQSDNNIINNNESTKEIPCILISDDENEEATINSGSAVLGLNNRNGKSSFNSKSILNKTTNIQSANETISLISDDENEETMDCFILYNKNGENSRSCMPNPASTTILDEMANNIELAKENTCISISDNENEQTKIQSGSTEIGINNQICENVSSERIFDHNITNVNEIQTNSIISESGKFNYLRVNSDVKRKRTAKNPLSSTLKLNARLSRKSLPPAPKIKIKKNGDIVSLIWDMKVTPSTATIEVFELFICQKTIELPDISPWKLVDRIKAGKLPMQCDMNNFDTGYTYFFGLRAVDIYQRKGPCQVVDITL